MKGIQTDIAIKNLEMFQEAITSIEAPKILDKKAAALRSRMDAGPVSEVYLLKAMGDILPDVIAMAGGGLRGTLKAQELLGRGGSAYSQKGADGQIGYFFGKEDEIRFGQTGTIMDEFFRDTIHTQAVTLGGFINNQMLQGTGPSSSRSALNPELFSNYIQNLYKINAGGAAGLSGAVERNTLFDGIELGSTDAIIKAFQRYDSSFTGTEVGLQKIVK